MLNSQFHGVSSVRDNDLLDILLAYRGKGMDWVEDLLKEIQFLRTREEYIERLESRFDDIISIADLGSEVKSGDHSMAKERCDG